MCPYSSICLSHNHLRLRQQEHQICNHTHSQHTSPYGYDTDCMRKQKLLNMDQTSQDIAQQHLNKTNNLFFNQSAVFILTGWTGNLRSFLLRPARYLCLLFFSCNKREKELAYRVFFQTVQCSRQGRTGMYLSHSTQCTMYMQISDIY